MFDRLYAWCAQQVRHLWREMVTFAVVGFAGMLCDLATFNSLIIFGHVPHVVGSVAGTTVGTLAAYLGSRFVVFRKRGRRQSAAEVILFLVVSGVALLITAACVAFDQYVLRSTSVLSANIAQYVFGQGLGSIFRFIGTHLWVFPEEKAAAGAEAEAVEGAVQDTVSSDLVVPAPLADPASPAGLAGAAAEPAEA